MISLFARTATEEATAENAKSTVRSEFIKKVASGTGWTLGGSIVFGAYELLHSDPHEAFPLLKSWGPWAIVTIVALYFGYDLLKVLLDIGTRLVVAVEHLAEAQQKSADKDDLQLQEIQTLTAYTSQQSERTYQKLAEHFDLTVELNKKLDTILTQGKVPQ